MSPTPDPARTVATTGATPSSSVVGDLGSILLLTAAWAGMAIQVDPRGEFSLNDDWAYALPVKALTKQGLIRFTFWQSMTLIGQVLWGALFCLPGGFSFLALRLSVLTAGLAGVLGLYGLCRHIGSGTALATLAALTLALNPIYFGRKRSRVGNLHVVYRPMSAFPGFFSECGASGLYSVNTLYSRYSIPTGQHPHNHICDVQ